MKTVAAVSRQSMGISGQSFTHIFLARKFKTLTFFHSVDSLYRMARYSEVNRASLLIHLHY